MAKALPSPMILSPRLCIELFNHIKGNSRIKSRIVLALNSTVPFHFDGQGLVPDLSESLDDGQDFLFDHGQNLLLFRDSLDASAVRVIDKQNLGRVFLLQGEVDQYVLGTMVVFDPKWIR
jgi:hypothetical protein